MDDSLSVFVDWLVGVSINHNRYRDSKWNRVIRGEMVYVLYVCYYLANNPPL